MKRIFAVSAIAMVAAMAMLGCEWSTHGDDVQGYNDTTFGWITFSGTYQRYYTTAVPHTTSGIEEGYLANDESQISGDVVVANPTGKPIHTMAVTQKGQRLSISDDGGGSYSGSISDIRSATGRVGTTNLVAGDVIVAPFSCSGKSGAGVAVTITGTFQGELVDGGSSAMVFTKRTISGTWIESNGRSCSVYGAAEPIVRYGYQSISQGGTTVTTDTDDTSSTNTDNSGESLSDTTLDGSIGGNTEDEKED